MHNILTFLDTPLGFYLVVSTIISAMLGLVLLIILRLKSAHLYLKTMFGTALIFDAEDGEKNPIRLLNVHNKFQSVSYIAPDKRMELACIYHQYMAQITDIVAMSSSAGLEMWKGRVLIIGGGGYSLPKWFLAHVPHAHITCVEIDPKITEIAKKHFFLDEACERFGVLPHTSHEGTSNAPTTPTRTKASRIDLVCKDGWEYLKECAESHKEFDIIINDAFGGARPLISLETHEGARVISRCLGARGVYMANVIASLEGKKRASLDRAEDGCLPVFKHVYLIAEADDEPEVLANNVLIASQTSYPLAPQYRIQG